MRESQLKKLPRQTLSIFFLCAGVGIVSYVLMLYPAKKLLDRLNGEISTLQNKVEEQKIFLPNYQKFLKINQEDMSGTLPSPHKNRLPKNKIKMIPALLKELVLKSDLSPVSITLDLKSLAGKPGFVSVNTLVKGELLNFRNFLMKLQEIPYLEHMENIGIKGTLFSKEFKLKLWIAIEK